MKAEYVAFCNHPSLLENQVKQGNQRQKHKICLGLSKDIAKPRYKQYEDEKQVNNEIDDNGEQKGKCNQSVSLNSAVNNIYGLKNNETLQVN